MLRDSGLGWSAVRNGMYSDEIATWFDADGRITGPGGDGRISLSYRPELAEAIAICSPTGVRRSQHRHDHEPGGRERSPSWRRSRRR